LTDAADRTSGKTARSCDGLAAVAAAVTPPVARAAAPNRAPPIRRLFLFMLTSLMGWEQVDVVRISDPDRF
jgi:hypothetical protein